MLVPLLEEPSLTPSEAAASLRGLRDGVRLDGLQTCAISLRRVDGERRRRASAALGGGTVVDASVAAAWCFEDEVSPFTEAALDEVVRNGARVPALWLVEMTNVLAMAERHGRLDAERVDRFLESLLALPVVVDRAEPGVLVPAVVRIARAQRLTAYDAAYLELAMRARLAAGHPGPSLRAAAERVGVALFAA